MVALGGSGADQVRMAFRRGSQLPRALEEMCSIAPGPSLGAELMCSIAHHDCSGDSLWLGSTA